MMWLRTVSLAIFMLALCCNAYTQQCIPSSNCVAYLKEALDSNYHDAPGNGGFRFRRILLEAACINEKDPDIIRRKMGLMWQRFFHEPASRDGSIHLGDILTYAFSIRYQRLMLPVAKEWQLDLNFLDENGRTLLDLLDEAIDTATKASTANMLKEYREIYIEAGARRRGELSFYIKNLVSRFQSVRRYAYGLFPVQKNNKWGWVNEKGIPVIPLQYKAIRHFVKDLFEVSDDGVNFYYVDRNNRRVDGPWQEQLPPWTGQPLQKKAKTTLFLKGDTLRQSDLGEDQRLLASWYKTGSDLVGYGYCDSSGNPYGNWKYYQLRAGKWVLYCEGPYTTIRSGSVQVDPDIAKRFSYAATAEAKEDFIKDLYDRWMFTGEWRFYPVGKSKKVCVMNEKVTIPYMISESEDGTITLLRAGQTHRMAGELVTVR